MPAPIKLANGAQLRPLTARSVILSTLLGADDGAASAYELVLVAREFDITDTALRAALSRMGSSGDLHRDGTRYQLSERLTARHHRQDAAVRHVTSHWDGTWQIAIVTSTGRSSSERVQLRTTLQQAKMSELREGVWMRPANLVENLSPHADLLILENARPTLPDASLVETLWDLPAWTATAEQLLDAYAASDTQLSRFTIAAAIVRHLLDDPALPATLVPSDYPAPPLRDLYAQYRLELADLRAEAGRS